MFEIHPGNWPVALDLRDPRNMFHEQALQDARIATDRGVGAPAVEPSRVGLVTRLRLAIGITAGAAVAEPCTCAA